MRRLLALVVLSAATACSGLSFTPPPSCDVARQTGCAAGLACEAVGSGSACFAPVLVRGTVSDPDAATTALPGARVVALDANRAPMSAVAVSGAGGAYELAVRAARDASGRPAPQRITLRADAQGYLPFPGGIRPALPVELATAVDVGGRWVVSGPLTQLELLRLGGSGWAAAHGSLAPAPSGLAPLVVAEPVGAGTVVTAIADRDGRYTLFNLDPDASYVVSAYAQGVNYAGAVTGLLDPGADTTLQAFTIRGAATASIGGNLIQNNVPNPSSWPFQVTLVVDSTYATTLDRGESPPGLTVPGFFGGNPGYHFTGVPDGTYRVLAAFGVDGLVRDVSGGGNTESPRVTVAGGVLQGEPPGFTICRAVHLVSIGGVPVGADPVVVVSTQTPEFHWVKESSYSATETFRVQVFDVYGALAWTRDVTGVTTDGLARYGTLGSAALPLVAGRPYQLRIRAYDGAASQLSQTEDLAGVFVWEPSP